MKENLYKYFMNLDKYKEGNKPIDLGGFSPIRTKVSSIYDSVKKVLIDDKGYFIKEIIGEEDGTLQAVASSRMYNSAGISTPPLYIGYKQIEDEKVLYEVSQDVNTLGCMIIPAWKKYFSIELDDFRDSLSEKFLYDKWSLLNNNDIREYFLQYMTDECFDQFVNMFLIDELRTDEDRHDENFFFYRGKGSRKLDGVIPIDLDNSRITYFDKCRTKKQFKNFLKTYYRTYTPLVQTDEECYSDRHNAIRNMLQEGKLTDSNVSALTNALSFDFPKSILDVGEEYSIDNKCVKSVYRTNSLLWEYNRNNLGRDLGL